jgi:hypothetical protein
MAELARAGIPVAEGLLDDLIEGAIVALSAYQRTAGRARPAAERLAFRELGLATGLAAVPDLLANPSAARVPRTRRTVSGRRL